MRRPERARDFKMTRHRTRACRIESVVALCVAVLVSGAGCAAPGSTETSTSPPIITAPTATGATTPASVTGQTWSLIALEGTAVSVPNERARPTLLFDAKEKRVSGLAAVNRFSGGYVLEGDALKFGQLLSTKMGGPPELNALETRFLRALERTTAFRIDNGDLELRAGNQVVARFGAKR